MVAIPGCAVKPNALGSAPYEAKSDMTGTARQPAGQKRGKDESARRRPGQVQAFGRVLARVTAPALKKRGLTHAELLVDWPRIVGAWFAEHTAPVKLAYPRGRGDAGTLFLAVAPALATVVQHDSPRLIERINIYFGHAAIARLRLTASTVSAPVRRKPLKIPLRGPVAAPSPAVANLGEGPLRAALERLERRLPR